MTPKRARRPRSFKRQLREIVLRQRTRAVKAHFSLPTPPSLNELTANVAGVGRVKTRVYRRWLEIALPSLLEQKVPLVPGELVVSITVPLGNDLDNSLKAVFDCLTQGYIILDDSQIIDLRIRRVADDCCRITIEALA